MQVDTFEEKRNAILNNLKRTSPSPQGKYKRVAMSPIRYAGGKSLAVGYIIELIPNNLKRLISPFFGGGSIEIALNKMLDIEIIAFDIFSILCNYWEFQINEPELLYKELKKLKPDKETFEKIRLVLRSYWKGEIHLAPITLATYYVYNFNLSYGPGFMGWSSKIYLNEERYKRMIDRIKDFKVNNFRVTTGSFENIIPNYPNEFLYCDPPYYLGEDSKMFKGIYPMRNIPIHHKGFRHDLLRDLLHSHKGGFILSYNDCPTIREFYKDFNMISPQWQYTMGQGETRIGFNRIKNGDSHIKTSHELIIYSPPRLSLD